MPEATVKKIKHTAFASFLNITPTEEFGGAGGNLSITYTIHLNGDPVLGTATIADGAMTFAPAQ